MPPSRPASRTRSTRRSSQPARSAGLTTDGFAKIDEIPYDFLRKRLTIVVAPEDAPAQHLIITKGAFANVLDICSRSTATAR